MAVTPPGTFAVLNGTMLSAGLKGTSRQQIALGLSQALTPWLATIPVTTVHVGIVGTGTGTGKVTLLAPTGFPILLGSLTSTGIKGVSVPQLVQGVTQGLATVMSTQAQVQVVLAGTAAGSGTGTLVTASAATLFPILLGSFTSAGLKGPSLPQFTQGLSQGIATWFKTGLINTVDVGSPVPPFVTVGGGGIGKVF
jgi:hypothetical protein